MYANIFVLDQICMWIPEHGSILYFFLFVFCFFFFCLFEDMCEVFCSKICKFILFSFFFFQHLGMKSYQGNVIRSLLNEIKKCEVREESDKDRHTHRERETDRKKVNEKFVHVSFCNVLREQFYRWKKITKYFNITYIERYGICVCKLGLS